MSEDEVDFNWRDEVRCEECAGWEGKPPALLAEVRKDFPPELGFEVSHAHHIAVAEGESRVVPITVIDHPETGQTIQLVPEQC